MKLALPFAAITLATAAPAMAEEFRPIFVPSGAGFEQALANDKDHFSVMIGLLRSADLPELRDEKPETLFAPTDAAFANYPKEKLAGLQKDPAAAQAFIRGHLVDGKVVFEQLFDGPAGKPVVAKVVTLDGSLVSIQCNEHPGGANKPHYPRVAGKAQVLAPDIAGDRGVIQVIDKPLVGD
jgi:uncharacterized surface protein with fasciclin (FAS1) repeats